MEERLLTYALKEDELVHILSVANGKACNCVCPRCKSPLVAKNGGLYKAPHFAHDSVKVCEGAYETALHLLAKNLLYKRRKIKLPNYHYDYIVFNTESLFKEGETVAFDEVILEQRVNVNGNFIIPDAIGKLNGRQVYIEFANTHFVDETKRKTLKNLDVASFEVDLSTTPLDEQAILDLFDTTSINKSWLNNPELDKQYLANQKKLLEEKKNEEQRNQEKIILQEEKKNDELKQMLRQLAIEMQEEEEKFVQYKDDKKFKLIESGWGEEIQCPLKAEKINALKTSKFYSHPILKKIMDGAFWNKTFYGRGYNGKWIFLEGNKIMVFPPDIEAKGLNEIQERGNKLLFAGLKQLQDLSNMYSFGVCLNCGYFIERIVHTERGTFEVCSYPKH